MGFWKEDWTLKCYVHQITSKGYTVSIFAVRLTEITWLKVSLSYPLSTLHPFRRQALRIAHTSAAWGHASAPFVEYLPKLLGNILPGRLYFTHGFICLIICLYQQTSWLFFTVSYTVKSSFCCCCCSNFSSFNHHEGFSPPVSFGHANHFLTLKIPYFGTLKCY